ncbi:MAG: sensor histidine kinase [Clostridia bacterium]|jgi:signal transduction histidine kinase
MTRTKGKDKKSIKSLFRILLMYFSYYKRAYGIAFLCFSVLFFIFYLYDLPKEPFYYGLLLIGTILIVLSVPDFIKVYQKHDFLLRLKKSFAYADLDFPTAKNVIEEDFIELVKAVNRERIRMIEEQDRKLSDMKEYYTVWAHQIKTPIAAMRLILQSGPSEKNDELSEQLFRIEQYVEPVLQYIRMEDMSSDLLIRRCSLDDCIKQAVRKYSKSFIRKKIKLSYSELKKDVLTDEKWLVFVIEQLLSNALKYTEKGEISIYMDEKLPDTLVIEDTGIGIAPEDLPRILEKGYTGYTGRADKRATGIGLYLCNTILKKMSHTFHIESVPGKGTKVKIGLGSYDLKVE